MSSFLINRRGRLVFPDDLYPEPELSTIDTIEDLRDIIRRDFEIKALTGDALVAKAQAGAYATKYELLRDLAVHLFWVERYALTLYEKRPTRWRDVSTNREDVFLPVVAPWVDAARKASAVERVYRGLSAAWVEEAEDALFDMLFDVFRYRRHRASGLSPIPPTAAEALADPGHLTLVLGAYEPDYPCFGFEELLDCSEEIPELEALRRWAITLHNQYPWDRSAAFLSPLDELNDDDVVVVLYPRSRDVVELIHRIRTGAARRPCPPAPAPARPPRFPVPPVVVRAEFPLQPRIEGLAVRRGEIVCGNDDIVRNAASSWSPMTAADILIKTGIETRCYTERTLEHLSLDAAQAALAHAGRSPQEIGAVIVCTCTSSRLLPSAASWLSSQLGMLQTHASVDLVAACAGFPYGLLEAVRVMQAVRRPILLVCADKFSDKIGSARTSRMLFGDGASCLVVGPAGPDAPGNIDVLQTYASGPPSEVSSIIWPNTEFGCDLTVYGPEVKSLVRRYLAQMMNELSEVSTTDACRSLVDEIELIVPHQANRMMVTQLATSVGVEPNKLYFNIERVGNTSAASIPLALHDAVADGVIRRPTRVFTPAFGAGAVAGYAVFTLEPATVAPESMGERRRTATRPSSTATPREKPRVPATVEAA